MKKQLILSALTGGILVLWTVKTPAAEITYNSSVGFRETQWSGSISIPQFNPALFGGAILERVTVRASSSSIGDFVLRAVGAELEYGNPVDRVGARLTFTGPLSGAISTITLTPNPITNIGTGFLANGQSISIPLNGSDQTIGNVGSAFFPVYTGSGTIDFNILARADITVSLSGSGFSFQGTRIDANAAVSVTYQYSNPLEIPEKGFNILGVAFCGLTGLALKKLGSKG